MSGTLAGVFGAWAMSIFAGEWERRVERQQAQDGKLFSGSPQERDATSNIASRMGRRILRRKLSRREREIGAAAVHYATGAALDAGYALAADVAPAATVGSGAAFGAAFWAIGDELLLPSVGFLRPPTEYDAAAHLAALGEHVVYGVVTDWSHRLLCRVL